MVQLAMNGITGTVDFDQWDSNDAAVVCRMLGYSGPAKAYYVRNMIDMLFSAGCSGTERNIFECENQASRPESGIYRAAVACNEIICSDPVVGPGVQRTGSSFTTGDSVTYTCKYGWKVLSGNTTITCMSDKTWKGAPLKCGRISCGHPGNLTHGFGKGKDFLYGTQVYFSCVEGYEIKTGSASRMCQADQTWSGTLPSCGEVSCAEPGMGPGVRRTGTSLKVGESLTYLCKDGWNVTSGDPKITCKSNRTWTGVVLQCDRVSCGNPGNITNGTLIGEDFLYESRVHFICTDGYEIKSGPESRVCQADQTWSGSQPTCEIIHTSETRGNVNETCQIDDEGESTFNPIYHTRPLGFARRRETVEEGNQISEAGESKLNPIYHTLLSEREKQWLLGAVSLSEPRPIQGHAETGTQWRDLTQSIHLTTQQGLEIKEGTADSTGTTL